jgi:hypothetical protein
MWVRTFLKALLVVLMSTLLGWLAYGTAAYGETWDVSALVVGCVSYVLILFFVLARD